ncbi:MAG TPA: hypothetical protein VGQ21_19945 [Thermoanaerobaculia bacterium]|nr:hypothetical protein [Thermoanaerobaculia bacterium]
MQNAAVTEVDRHRRHWPLGAPVQNEVVAKVGRDLAIGIKHGAEVAAIRAAHLHTEVAEETEREDRAVRGRGHPLRFIQIGKPVKTRPKAIGLTANSIERRAEALLGLSIARKGTMSGEHCVDRRLTAFSERGNGRTGDGGIAIDGSQNQRIGSVRG